MCLHSPFDSTTFIVSVLIYSSDQLKAASIKGMENEGTLFDLLQTCCIVYSECSGGILWSKSFGVTVVRQRSTKLFACKHISK